MDKPPPAAATMQSCLQRLQYLQTHFQNIGSPAELADAEREGGHILALLLHGKHIEPDILIPNSRDLLLDYAAGALDWQPMDNGLAENYQLSLWTFLAMGCSVQPRVVLHDAGPAPAWTYSITNGEHKYEHRWPADVRLKTTDRAKDFRQQGKRYSLWVSELLTRIQPATVQQLNGSPDANSSSSPGNGTNSHNTTKRPFTDGELVDALDALLNKATEYYSAERVRQHLLEKHPDRTIGQTKIKGHDIWKQHRKEWGKHRAPRNTSTRARKANLETLVAQQRRREQQTRYKGADRIVDGD
jgi:hypothetical protein